MLGYIPLCTGLRISLNKELRPAVRPSLALALPLALALVRLALAVAQAVGLSTGLGPGPRAIVEKSENVQNFKSSQNGLAYSGKS